MLFINTFLQQRFGATFSTRTFCIDNHKITYEYAQLSYEKSYKYNILVYFFNYTDDVRSFKWCWVFTSSLNSCWCLGYTDVMWMWSTISYVVRFRFVTWNRLFALESFVVTPSVVSSMLNLGLRSRLKILQTKTRIFKYKNRYNHRLLNNVLK